MEKSKLEEITSQLSPEAKAEAEKVLLRLANKKTKEQKDEEKRLKEDVKQQKEQERLQNLESKFEERQQKEEQERLRVELAATDFLKKNPDIYFVAGEGLFYTLKQSLNPNQTPNIQWTTCSEKNFLRANFNNDTPVFTRVFEILQHFERVKEITCRKIAGVLPFELNLLNYELKRIKPEAGEVNEAFDFLMSSLSGGNQEAQQHLEQVIGWKYLHPADWTIPAICWYGEGNAGKGILVDSVLKTIWGNDMTNSVSFESIKQYQDQIINKMVVLIDEAGMDKTDDDWLKRHIGNATYPANLKYGANLTCQSTSLWFIATNSPKGPLRLGNNGADRRFSIIKLAKQLPEVIRDEIDPSLSIAEVQTEMKEAGFYKIFTDKSECAKFLNRCVEAAKALASTPAAYQQTDYTNLLSNQERSQDVVFHEITESEKPFEFISVSTLYALYKKEIENNNVSMRNKIPSAKTIANDFESFIQKKKLNIIKARKRVASVKGVSQPSVFIRSDLAEDTGTLDDNHNSYEYGEHLLVGKPNAVLSLVK